MYHIVCAKRVAKDQIIMSPVVLFKLFHSSLNHRVQLRLSKAHNKSKKKKGDELRALLRGRGI